MSRRCLLAIGIALAVALTVLAGPTLPSVAARPDRAHAIVELSAPPTAEGIGEGAARLGQPLPVPSLDRVRQQQAALKPQIARLGGRVIEQYRLLYNGFWVLAPRAALAEIGALPGVVAVHPTRRVRLANTASVAFIGAPQVWQGLGNRGEGVRIAILDTGIDYTHAAFGGPGTPAAYQANNGRIIEPGSFPTAKVIGGYDFAGDFYRPNPDDPDSQIPRPDPDPLDQQGHGSHVAGTAAGFGVSGKVGVGVAPGALLYALKVFGIAAWTPDALVMAGLERAVDPNGDGDISDRVDIINMSLADDYGVASDPLCVASSRAAAAGCIVVAAAGNAGNRPYVTGTPGVAEGVLSVGASLDSSFGERADHLATFTSRGPRRGDTGLKPDLVAPGFGIPSVRAGSGDGARVMSGTSMATPHVAGVAALLKRQHPNWSAAEIRAALINTTTSTLIPGAAAPISLQGAGRVQADVAARASTVALGAKESTSLSFGFVPTPGAQTLAQEIVVRNKSKAPREFALSAAFRRPDLQDAGARLTLDPPTVAVPPGDEARARLVIILDPLALRGVGTFQEYDGLVTLAEKTNGRETLRLPFHLIPKPVSRTTATLEPDGRTVRLRGEGALPSVAEVFTLAVEDPADAQGDADLRAAGVRARGTTAADRMIEFAIATHRPWSTASGEVVRFGVEIDIDRDARPDYRIETRSAVVTLVNLATNRSQVSSTPAVIDFNQSVARVTVRAADIGLGAGGPFDFIVTSDTLYGDPDATRRTSFDLGRPAFVPSVTRLEFRGGASFTVAVDAEARNVIRSRGLLLVYPNDAPGVGQAQVLPFP